MFDKKLLEINQDAMSEELSTLPGLFATVSSALAIATKQVSLAEIEYRMMKSTELLRVKSEQNMIGGKMKFPTIDEAEAIVNMDRNLNDKKFCVFQLQLEESELMSFKEALRIKKECMQMFVQLYTAEMHAQGRSI